MKYGREIACQKKLKCRLKMPSDVHGDDSSIYCGVIDILHISEIGDPDRRPEPEPSVIYT